MAGFGRRWCRELLLSRHVDGEEIWQSCAAGRSLDQFSFPKHENADQSFIFAFQVLFFSISSSFRRNDKYQASKTNYMTRLFFQSLAVLNGDVWVVG
jgi:hypothetical protein